MAIPPTVGRVVLYYEHGKTQLDAGEQPQVALVAYVHGDRLVNLAIFDRNGNSVVAPPTSVVLVQPGDEVPQHAFCCWLPHQLAQTVRHAQSA